MGDKTRDMAEIYRIFLGRMERRKKIAVMKNRGFSGKVKEIRCIVCVKGVSKSEMRDRGTSGGADCTHIDEAACQR